MAVGPLLCMMRKEFLQLRRDRAMMALIIVMPLIQLVVLSNALNNDLKNIRISVLDEDRTPLSRRLVDSLDQADAFVLGPAASGPEVLREHLQKGRSDLALHVPHGFAADAIRGERPQAGLYVDGVNSSIAGRAAADAAAVVAREGGRDPESTLKAAGASAGPTVTMDTRYFYNSELESRIYMVPGVVVMLVTLISALITGMAVVREKEIGTLEQVLVTPLTPLQFILGKTLPIALIALFDLALASGVAMVFFDVPLTGSSGVLVLGTLAYLSVTLGLGLLASAVSDTQQQAMFTVWFFLTFAMLLSGFFFPVQNMPVWSHPLVWINPMSWYMNIVRGVFLKGATVTDLARELLVLAGMGALAYGLALARFGRTTD